MTRTSSGVVVLALFSGAALAGAAEPEKAAEKHAAPATKAPAATATNGSTTAPAAAEVPTTPSPELDMLYKGYEGNWKCDTTMAPGAVGPNSPELKMKSMVRIAKAKDLSGFWYRGEYDMKKTKTTPGFRGTFMLGYDAGSKTALNLSYDNTGGATLATAHNASGDSVTFLGEGYMNGTKARTRETMTRKSPKEVEHKFEVDMGKGFVLMGTDECKK